MKAMETLQFQAEARSTASTEFFEMPLPQGTMKLRQLMKSADLDEYDGKLGTGSTVWDSAWVMVRWLERCEAAGELQIPGLRILELGSGTGVVGLAAMALGAQSVVLTDFEPLLFLLRENAERNASSLGYDLEQVAVSDLAWGSSIPEGGPWDVVIACDVVVPIFDSEALADQFATLLDGHAPVCYMTYEERNAECGRRFVCLCEERGMEVIELAREQLDPKYSPDDIKILRLRKIVA